MKTQTGQLDEELSKINFGDERINQRLQKVMQGLRADPGSPICRCMISGAEAKAAYRFFENEKVTAKLICDEHRRNTRKRMEEYDEALDIQDTTFLDYSRHLHKEGLGSIGKWRKENPSTKGLIAHYALAVTLDGIPLGILDQLVWPRLKNAKKVESKMVERFFS